MSAGKTTLEVQLGGKIFDITWTSTLWPKDAALFIDCNSLIGRGKHFWRDSIEWAEHPCGCACLGIPVPQQIEIRYVHKGGKGLGLFSDHTVVALAPREYISMVFITQQWIRKFGSRTALSSLGALRQATTCVSVPLSVAGSVIWDKTILVLPCRSFVRFTDNVCELFWSFFRVVYKCRWGIVYYLCW